MLLLLAASIVSFPAFSFAEEGMTLMDAGQALQIATEAATPSVPDGVADANGDGSVTAADAALLLRYARGRISSLPEAGLPLSMGASLAAARRMAVSELELDFSGAFEALDAQRISTYETLAENAAAFEQIAGQMQIALQTAAIKSMTMLSRDFRQMNVSLRPAVVDRASVDWRRVAAMYRIFGADGITMLTEHLQMDWQAVDGEGTRLTVSFPDAAAAAAFGTRAQHMNAHFAETYLRTVYDDGGAELPIEKRVYSEEYLSTVAHPLPGCTIKNGWFDPRDRHTRYHTGTDILAAGRTHIQSVTDGTVLYIGYLPIPGNYVVIRDPSGYEYHYYHMYEKSKMVKEGDTVVQGQAIGRVGNTGNSAANHLHLTIIAPDGVYVNPYDLFVQAGIGPIKPDGT